MSRLVLLALLFAACGDKDDTGTDTTTTEEADTDTDTDADTDTDTDTGPQSCEQDSDCEGACPDGSLDCICAEDPTGASVCVPTCSTDEDCVMEGMICEVKLGICIPEDEPQ